MTNTSRFYYIFAASFLISNAGNFACSQDDEMIALYTSNENEEIFEFSYGAPTSPALALSGLKSSQFTKVNEYEKFLLSYIPSEGNGIPDAFAIDIKPGQLLEPVGLKLQKNYRGWSEETLPERAFRNLSVGLVVREGNESDNKPSENRRSLLSLGLTTSLLPGSDPVYQFSNMGAVENSDCGKKLSEGARNYQDSIERSNNRESAITVITDSIAILDLPNTGNLIEIVEPLNKAKSLMEAEGDPIDVSGILTGDYSELTEGLTRSELKQELEKIKEAINKTPKAIYTEDFSNTLSACRRAIEDAVKFAPNLDVGLGLVWRGEDDRLADFEDGGKALWFSYRHPVLFKKSRQKIRTDNESSPTSYFVTGAYIRAGFDEFVKIDDMTVSETQADTIQAAAGIEYFSENFSLSVQYGYGETDIHDTSFNQFSKEGERFAIGANMKLTEKVWIALDYGDAQGSIDSLQGEKLNVNLKFQSPDSFDIFGL